MQDFLNIHIKNIYPYAVFPYICTVFTFLLTLNIIIRNYKNRLTRSISVFCLSLILWTGSGAVMINTPNKNIAEIMHYFYFIGWLLIPVLYLNMVLFFAEKRRIIILPVILVFSILLIFAFTGDYTYIEMTYFGYYARLKPVMGYITNVVYFLVTGAGLTVIMMEFDRAETNTRRNQAKQLWIGSSIGYMFSLTESILVISNNPVQGGVGPDGSMYGINIIIQLAIIIAYISYIYMYSSNLFIKISFFRKHREIFVYVVSLVPFTLVITYIMIYYGYAIYPISWVGLLIAVFLISYAALKYRIFDITHIFKKIITYSLLSAIFVFFYIAIIAVFSEDMENIIPSTIFALCLVFFFNPVYMSIQNIVDRILFRRRFDYQTTIRNISSKLVTVLDYDKLINLIQETIIGTLEASSFVLLLYSFDADEYQPVLSFGIPGKLPSFRSTDHCIKLIMLANREIFKEELMEDEDEHYEYLQLFNALKVSLVIPMTYKGALRGILAIGDKESGEIYNNRDIELLQILANQAIIAIDNARLYELAITDELTNLYIVRFFNQRIVEEIITAVRLNSNLSLLMIDIDYFKSVNDKYGHQTGDAVLRDIAVIVTKQVRANDLVARYGGEEFAVILPGASNRTASMIAERIRSSVEDHVFAMNIRRTVSIGISTLDGSKIMTRIKAVQEMSSSERREVYHTLKEAMVRHADEALYEAKNTGRNRCSNNGLLEL